MRVLVTFAVAAEFAPWRARHAFLRPRPQASQRQPDCALFTATIAAAEVGVLLTGMGRESALRAMNSVALDSYDLCISTGLAGALDAAWRPGEIAAGRSVALAGGPRRLPSDGGLLDCAVSCGARPVDLFLTSETIAATGGEKQALGAFGNIVEMESFHVLEAAGAARVPAVALRAISDTLTEDLPLDFQRVLDSRGRVRVGRMMAELALHPQRIPALVRFGRQSRSAAESLADFLDRYVPALAGGWHRLSAAGVEEVSAT
ncbi:MAG: hypothetical protein LAN84_13525 [Acidobacteriia bacterium]|nr:hypothetical protein [Terriglobia bacterium]